MKDLLLTILQQLYAIVVILRYKLWKYPIGQDSIINSVVPVDDVYVDSPNGFVPLTAIHLKTRSALYELESYSGDKIVANDNHMFYTDTGEPIQMHDITVGQVLLLKGRTGVVYDKVSVGREHTFDITVAGVGDHAYWSNNYMSHNSITSAIFITWYIINNYDKTVVCTSANEDKVKELIEKIDTIMINLPFYMKLGIEIDNVKVKKYDNGCKIIGETATENSGAGNTANLLYSDEFALVDPTILDNFFRVIYPTLSANKNSKMIITSTARGLNKFYQIYNDAINGKNFFNPIRTDWFDVDGRDEAWKAQEIANLGSVEDFNQEYGNQFIAGNQLLFSSTLLKRLKRYERKFMNNQLDIIEELSVPIINTDDTDDEW